MESVLSFPLHTFPEFYYWSLKINWNTLQRILNFFPQKHCKSPHWKGKPMFCFQPVCSSSALQCGPCTALAHGKESLGLLAIISSSITCGCRVFITTRQDNGWSSREKKPSPMISLTSLFCHRLIQNSFQVTWTTLKSGNVLAATTGTNIGVLAVASSQYSQIRVPAVPPNILLIGKKRSL